MQAIPCLAHNSVLSRRLPVCGQTLAVLWLLSNVAKYKREGTLRIIKAGFAPRLNIFGPTMPIEVSQSLTAFDDYSKFNVHSMR